MSIANYTAQEVASLYTSSVLENGIELAATVMASYDHILTFGDECRVFHNSKWTAITGLYYFNRAIAALSTVVFIAYIPISSWHREQSVEAIQMFSFVLQFLSIIIWAVFSSIRVYALLQLSRILACISALIVFLVSILPFVFNLYTLTSTRCILPSGTRMWLCIQTAKTPALTVLMRAPAIAGDALVILCTYIGVYRIEGSVKTPLAVLLIRNGSLCFGLLLVVNVIVLVLDLSSPWGMGQLGISLSSIVMSRFILDLRCKNRADVCQSFTHLSSEVAFHGLERPTRAIATLNAHTVDDSNRSPGDHAGAHGEQELNVASKQVEMEGVEGCSGTACFIVHTADDVEAQGYSQVT